MSRRHRGFPPIAQLRRVPVGGGMSNGRRYQVTRDAKAPEAPRRDETEISAMIDSVMRAHSDDYLKVAQKLHAAAEAILAEFDTANDNTPESVMRRLVGVVTLGVVAERMLRYGVAHDQTRDVIRQVVRTRVEIDYADEHKG